MLSFWRARHSCHGTGAAHITADNVHESWLSDDQVSDMNAGVNGPIDRNEGAYNGYAAVKAF